VSGADRGRGGSSVAREWPARTEAGAVSGAGSDAAEVRIMSGAGSDAVEVRIMSGAGSDAAEVGAVSGADRTVGRER